MIFLVYDKKFLFLTIGSKYALKVFLILSFLDDVMFILT